ncbi:MarR family winged helix-turn-helix transcriptional regulator [Protaetiibacter mangrovi]|uniref:MarR family transcriptional regulator n=1 Tax=Protaetiibacter mangrovi TaxID=2970926 RepID=A0ABT1ZCJ6_9MICO|nr:MarR family transcriptional regulator [Protaetiibacter mangrovi]MCS0498414.1 MarR family transcriptional regulator [Protaetiibacter mangrovi]
MRDTVDDWPTGRLLAVAARLVEQRWREALEERGLSYAGLIVLHTLDAGGRSLGVLARAAHVTAQTMGRTVEHLERDGYVRTVVDAGDRRRRLVERTDAGARVFAEMHGLEARMFPELEQSEQLRATLLEIIRAVGGDPQPPAVTPDSLGL